MIEPPIGYVRLRDAVDMVGQKMKGTRWRPVEWPVGPYSVLVPEQSNPDLDEIITTIAKQCEAGEIVTAYRTITGSTEKLKRRVWQRPQWRNYFATGTIELDLPLVDVNGQPNADGHTARCTREILVRREDIERLIGALSPPTTSRATAAKIKKIVESYRKGLAPGASPSIPNLERFAKEEHDLTGHRDELRDEYHRQLPDQRPGRPAKK